MTAECHLLRTKARKGALMHIIRRLLGARLRSERQRHRRRAVERHQLLGIFQQSHRAAARAGVARGWHDAGAAGYALHATKESTLSGYLTRGGERVF